MPRSKQAEFHHSTQKPGQGCSAMRSAQVPFLPILAIPEQLHHSKHKEEVWREALDSHGLQRAVLCKWRDPASITSVSHVSQLTMLCSGAVLRHEAVTDAAEG